MLVILKLFFLLFQTETCPLSLNWLSLSFCWLSADMNALVCACCSDQNKFQNLDTGVGKAMMRVSFAVSIEVLEGKYSDESATLRDAVCTAAGRPTSGACCRG